MKPFTNIIKRECDIPMARKKGFFPCNKKCEKCHACIETTISGERQHVNNYKWQPKSKQIGG